VHAQDLVQRLVAQQQAVTDLVEHLRLVLDEPVQNQLRRPSLLDETAAPPTSARVVIRCLGRFAIHIDGEPVDAGRPTKALSLFQYLLAHRGRPTPRHVLIDELWPDPEALAAASSLKVAVHGLRQLLTSLGGERAGLGVEAQAAGYQLNGTEVWIDSEAFEAHFHSGSRLDTQGRQSEASAEYRRAGELYQGDFLEACVADWAVLRREALKDQYLFVLDRLANDAMADGDCRGCIVHCQRLLEYDACREDTYRLLLEAHGRLGQRERVQTWYDMCVHTLRAKLDVAPEPETSEAYRRALFRASAPALKVFEAATAQLTVT
jgi:DNA-binding SARP family transcriptional activator